MAQITLAEAELQLVQINQYISDFLAGKRKKEIVTGSHEFQRTWKWSEIKLSDLMAERSRLSAIVDALSPTQATPIFRANTSFPLIVSRNS